MGDLQLNEVLFAKLAGWEAVKHARGLVTGGRVLASDWQPPLLKGAVREGAGSAIIRPRTTTPL